MFKSLTFLFVKIKLNLKEIENFSYLLQILYQIQSRIHRINQTNNTNKYKCDYPISSSKKLMACTSFGLTLVYARIVTIFYIHDTHTVIRFVVLSIYIIHGIFFFFIFTFDFKLAFLSITTDLL